MSHLSYQKLDSPIETFSGIGSGVLEKLHKLGVKKIRDLLFYLPFRYEDFSNIKKIADLAAGEKATVTAKILNIGNKRTWKRRMNITEALLEDKTAPIRAVWFNQPYLTQTLKKELWVNISGKVSLDNMGLCFSNPVFEVLGSGDPQGQTSAGGLALTADSLHTGGLIPIYPETEGLTSRWLRLKIRTLLDNLPPLADFLPPLITKEFRLIPLNHALRQIHFPKNKSQIEAAQKRLAFGDLFALQLFAYQEKQKIKSQAAQPLTIDLPLVKNFIGSLSFQLTNSQKLAAWQILKDLEQSSPMNRILIGEVGSGKTVVAAIAALNTAANGYQTAFLAPTEILAQQHFKTISQLFADRPADVALMTSSQAKLGHTEHPSISKKELIKKIGAGQIRIVIGTHALIQKEVKFGKLALVVVDEQHRFGVEQRSALLRRPTQTDTQTDADFLYEDITYRIRAAAFKVKKEVGLGHKESVYQNALAEEFKALGLKFEREKRIKVFYKEKPMGFCQPDFLIENKIIVEIKSLPFITKKEATQLWTYLKGSDYRLALLINFSSQDVQMKRVVYDLARRDSISPRQSASSLRKSAPIPHLLTMTATPIPRTLALTLYGDLDLSTLKELPRGRKKIITRIVAPANREKAYAFIENQIKMVRQAFVICPLIEESQALIMSEVKAAAKEYDKLSKEVFPHLKIGLLHGRLKSAEKEQVMRDFKDRKLDILVSTSVVEVGIDVPNATVMMIEGADRFGLSQLHQFRGRVGRAEHQSYCFLFTEAEGKTANSRLRALAENEDGFKLAERDLQLRGPGQFFGTAQSGLPDLAMSSLKNTALIEEVQQAVKLFTEKTTLDEYPLLKQKLADFGRDVHWE